MKDCRLIILNHYDFKNDKGEQVKGSKCKVAKGQYSTDITENSDRLFKLELLKEYKCDLCITDKFKIAITNIY